MTMRMVMTVTMTKGMVVTRNAVIEVGMGDGIRGR